MGLVVDTGALIAFERGDRELALIEAVRGRREQIVTSSGCVAQAWRRGGSAQAWLARLLRGLNERSLDSAISRQVGELCSVAATSDIVDALVALLARDDDTVMSSDPADLRWLLGARSSRAVVRRC